MEVVQFAHTVAEPTLKQKLRELALSQYLDVFVQEGFDTWDTLLDITEADLEHLGVKLGHRRKIQQAIALTTKDVKARPRRKYRRHPKPDGNAPKRPPTAYVSFANKLREDLSDTNLTFVEIARLVGEKWQALHPKERETWETQASQEKDRYYELLAQYKMTEDYQAYLRYLDKFKASLATKAIKEKPRRRSIVTRIDGANDSDDSSSDVPSQETSPEAHASVPSSNIVRTNPGGNRVNGWNAIAGIHAEDATPLIAEIVSRLQLNADEAGTLGAVLNNASFRNTIDSPLTIGAVPPQMLQGFMLKILSESLNYQSHQSHLQPLLEIEGQDMEIALTSSMNINSHVQAINPFRMQSRAVVMPLLKAFSSRYNSIFFFIRSEELERYFEQAYDPNVILTNKIMFELCLSIALGAQASEYGSNDMAVMWYENGRRYLDDDDWDSHFWVMRALTMISAYHLPERKDTARHYLYIAIRIARANNIPAVCRNQQNMDEYESETWLRVWGTMVFLHGWLEPRSSLASLAEYDVDPDLVKTISPSKVVVDARMTQIQMKHLLVMMHQTIENLYVAEPVGGVYEFHIQGMRSWLPYLPNDVQRAGFAKDSYSHVDARTSMAAEQHMSAMIHLHSMRLGVMMILTRPLLLQAADLVDMPISSTLEKEAIVSNAFLCLDSASELAALCTDSLSVNWFPPMLWLPSHFLFEASLVAGIGVTWQSRASSQGSRQRVKQCRTAYTQALAVFRNCATRNRTALKLALILSELEEYILCDK